MTIKNIKKKISPFYLVVISILIIFMLTFGGLFVNKKLSRTKHMEVNDPSTFTKETIPTLPTEWSLTVNDTVKGCYSINVTKEGNYTGDLEEYINSGPFGGRPVGKIRDLNTFNINSPNVIDLGQMGVGNFNTIYVKSDINDIFILEINSAQSQSEPGEDCPDLEPVVKSLVNWLL